MPRATLFNEKVEPAEEAPPATPAASGMRMRSGPGDAGASVSIRSTPPGSPQADSPAFVPEADKGDLRGETATRPQLSQPFHAATIRPSGTP